MRRQPSPSRAPTLDIRSRRSAFRARRRRGNCVSSPRMRSRWLRFGTSISNKRSPVGTSSISSPSTSEPEDSRLTFICATRLLKNARHVQATAPEVLPRVEPLQGFGSRVPDRVLSRLHTVLRPDDLKAYPELAAALRRAPVPRPRTVATEPLFQGTFVFVQVTFRDRKSTRLNSSHRATAY